MIEHETLYVVATPIGNLQDMTQRARDVLQQVDLIVAEDTRHSRQLLQHFAISTKMQALHQHNEQAKSEQIVARLRQGSSVALISDAGTPAISDPGYLLVRAVSTAGFSVRPVPGVSAVTTALSVAGLAADKFTFHGFLPTKTQQRLHALQALAELPETVVLYEAPHRIMALLAAIPTCFGEQRELMIGREMCKYFESFYRGTSEDIQAHLNAHPDEICGEFVVCIAGNPEPLTPMAREVDKILQLLLPELPINKAAKVVAKITGIPKNQVYERALTLQSKL